MENNTIKKIENLMKENSLTANKLAIACKLQNNTFTYWKNGKTKPTIDALIKIADYFDVSLDYLVGRETPTAKKEINNPNKAINSTLLNRIESLDELQQAKVMAYIDGLQDTNSSIKNAFYNGVNKEKNKQTLQVNTKLHNENI